MGELVHGDVSFFREGDHLAGDVVGFAEGDAFADEVVCKVCGLLVVLSREGWDCGGGVEPRMNVSWDLSSESRGGFEDWGSYRLQAYLESKNPSFYAG